MGLKVYSWAGFPPSGLEVPGRGHRFQEVKCVIAARSKSEAMRLTGVKPNSVFARDFVGETFNDQDVAAALARPGVVLYRAQAGRHPFVAAEDAS
jgi:hypothetical protein